MPKYIAEIPDYGSNLANSIRHMIELTGDASLTVDHNSPYDGCYILEFEAEDHQEALNLIRDIKHITEQGIKEFTEQSKR